MFKKVITLSLLVSLSAFSGAKEGMIDVKSHHSVDETADKLEQVLLAKGMTVFNRVEHAKSAQKVGVTIPDSVLIIFGNPKIGSALMKCAPTSAIDLPLKALIAQDENQDVWISYNDMGYLRARHSIKGCEQITNKMSGALSKFANAAAN